MKRLYSVFALILLSMILTSCAIQEGDSSVFPFFGTSAVSELPEKRADFAEKLALPDLLSDHAVLQRGPATNIWGKASPNAAVHVYFAGKHVKCTADEKGDWLTQLDLANVKEGPFDLIVQTGEKEQLTRSDILVGEVFLAGGQSNMEKRIGPWTGQQPVYDHEKIAKESAAFTRIRCANIEHKMSPVKLESIPGKWELPNEKTTPLFPAAAWFFAVEFQKQYNVPVGIINNSHGGSKMQVWTSREALIAAGEDPDEEFRGKRSTQLYNAEVWPIRNATFKAVLWYQGEQNGWESEKFEKLFKVMIDDWRSLWKNPKLPFIFVQLPSFRDITSDPADANYWAQTREAQRMAALHIPDTYMVVTTDTGEIADVHTRDKLPIGERLAWATLNKVYGKTEFPADSPIFKEAKRAGSNVIIKFDRIGDGLEAHAVKTKAVNKAKSPDVPYTRSSPNTELENFALMDESGKWHWADEAKITGKDTVSVSSKSVAVPVKIRYNLSSFAFGNLYGKNGLPATQFEEDIPTK